MKAMVEAEGVGRVFGDLAVLEDVGFALGQGEVLSVIGPSGCGKSTLLGLIAGLDEPTTGAISVEGHPDAGAIRHAGKIARHPDPRFRRPGRSRTRRHGPLDDVQGDAAGRKGPGRIIAFSR